MHFWHHLSIWTLQDKQFTPKTPSAYKLLDQMTTQCNAFRPEGTNGDKSSLSVRPCFEHFVEE